MKMTYFNNLNHQYNRVIFEFTDKEMKTAGFEKFNFMPNRLEILSVLQRINSNDLKKSGPPETLEAHLSHLEETIKRFSREDYADLQRKKDGWKAKALRLIGFLNDKDKKIEQLEVKIVRAIACIEDGFYDKAKALLQQTLKNHQ